MSGLEDAHPSQEQLSRAYEEGVLLGAKLKMSSESSAIGTLPEQVGAFQLGLEKGNEILEKFHDETARTWEAGHAVATYKVGKEKAN